MVESREIKCRGYYSFWTY